MLLCAMTSGSVILCNTENNNNKILLDLILTIFEHIKMPLLMHLVVSIYVCNIQLLKFRELTEWLQECLHMAQMQLQSR